MKTIFITLSIFLFVAITGIAQNEKIEKFYDTKPGSGYNSIGTDFAYIGDSIMIFQMWSNEAGYELWRTNGTAEGTYLVKDINAKLDNYHSPSSSSPSYFHHFNGKVYFRASDADHGLELWCTDGTEAGTTMVKDIAEGSSGALNPTAPIFCVYKDELYFQAKENANLGRELWKTDGTEEGTVLVKDILSEDGKSSYPDNFIVFNDLLFFTAKTNLKSNYYDNEIWYTDGTATGTLRLSNLPSEQTPTTEDMVVLNNDLIFKGNLDHGLELWKTDGTSEGTLEIKDINPGDGYGVSDGDEMVELNGELFFKGNTEALGYELWKTDGTEAGTVLVKDINAGQDGSTPYSSSPNFLCSFDHKVFFAARNEDSGTQLWASDGTTDGTTLYYGSKTSGTWNPSNLINVNHRFYFTLNTSAFGQPYLYAMDASDDTPVALEALDFSFKTYNRAFGTFFTLKNTLYFQADLETNTGFELYKLKQDEPECSLGKLPKPTGISQICENINVNMYSIVNNNTQATVNWVLEPHTAGTLSATGNDVRVSWNLAHIGNVKLWAYLSENECAGENSDTLTIERIALPDKPEIWQKGNLLVATSASGYQWFKRVGNAISGYLDPINGAVERTYSPTENGAYAVEISNKNGCAALSEAYAYVNTGISEKNMNAFQIYPNPNNGHFTVQLANEVQGTTLTVTDAMGRIVTMQEVGAEKTSFALDLASGIYFVKYTSNNNANSLQKMVVK